MADIDNYDEICDNLDLFVQQVAAEVEKIKQDRENLQSLNLSSEKMVELMTKIYKILFYLFSGKDVYCERCGERFDNVRYLQTHNLSSCQN